MIHPEFEEALSLTGRIPSREPNLQRPPLRTEEAKKIRDAFIRPGTVIDIESWEVELRFWATLVKEDSWAPSSTQEACTSTKETPSSG